MNNRTEQFHFFATPEEAKLIRDREKEIGILNESAYLRKMAIDGYLIQMDLSDVKEAVRLLGITSANMNQYAKKANETGKLYEEDIAEIKQMHNEQTKFLKKILEAVMYLYEEDSKKKKWFYGKASAWLCGLSAVQGDWGIPQQAKMRRVYTGALLANL